MTRPSDKSMKRNSFAWKVECRFTPPASGVRSFEISEGVSRPQRGRSLAAHFLKQAAAIAETLRREGTNVREVRFSLSIPEPEAKA